MSAPIPAYVNPLSHDHLKQRHRQLRQNHPTPLTLRIHRALSWLRRSEMADDIDGKFIFLWIAFNAAYAQEMDPAELASEKALFMAFLEKLCSLDKTKLIDQLIWNEFSGSVRALLDNPYVFPQFWEFQRGRITEAEWKDRFAQARRAAHAALAGSNAPVLLSVIFQRLYTLRNQLMHGGATWNGSVNREQLRDCTSLLGKLVPIIITLMMDNPDTVWGEAVYPVVSTDS
jgi:Apea-like HEPN